MLKYLTILVLFLGLLPNQTRAIYDPLSVPNNRFGIHIVDENDLEDAASLVNSSGGDWGYVKLVIRENDRNLDKWQAIFNKMRRLHLIPIIRLATRIESGRWIKPRIEDIKSWLDFLTRLNWVSENRYVILFNEPNHAKEWGDEIKPDEYAFFVKEFSTRLKERSSDFFVLPAGLDASATNTSETMDEEEFLRRMYQADKQIFSYFDGWTSHSYPNPDFSASPLKSGRGSLKTYLWELSLLANYGFYPDKIFITETGWAHNEDKNNGLLSPATVADYYLTAFTQSWNDSRIVAITPFLLNYQDEPFGKFSWKKFQSEEYYPMYETIRLLPKNRGAPKQRIIVKLDPYDIAQTLVINSKYRFYLGLENLGQAIIGESDAWKVEIEGLDDFVIKIDELPVVEPNSKNQLTLFLSTPNDTKKYDITIRLVYEDKEVSKIDKTIVLIPPPSLTLFTHGWLKKATGDFRLLIYDENELLIYEKFPVTIKEGFAQIPDLYGIVPGRPYRIVLLRDYYLPRQLKTIIGQSPTGLQFPPLLPLDFSNDGALNLLDILAFVRYPLLHLKRISALD